MGDGSYSIHITHLSVLYKLPPCRSFRHFHPGNREHLPLCSCNVGVVWVTGNLPREKPVEAAYDFIPHFLCFARHQAIRTSTGPLRLLAPKAAAAAAGQELAVPSRVSVGAGMLHIKYYTFHFFYKTASTYMCATPQWALANQSSAWQSRSAVQRDVCLNSMVLALKLYSPAHTVRHPALFFDLVWLSLTCGVLYLMLLLLILTYISGFSRVNVRSGHKD